MIYSPNQPYILSKVFCRTTLEGGDIAVNHLLGRMRVRLSPRAALVLNEFEKPNTAGCANRAAGLSTRQLSELIRTLRHANILQIPGNDEEERIRDAYRRRPGTLAFDDIEPPRDTTPPDPAPGGDLRLAPGLIVLELGNEEVLLGRPLEGPLHLTRALWSLAQQLNSRGDATTPAHQGAIASVPLLCFLASHHVLLAPDEARLSRPPPQRARGREFSFDRPNLDRFRQIVQPYGVGEASAAVEPLRILLVGPCQVQALAEALEWVGARRGFAVTLQGALDPDEVRSGERFDVAILPVAQFASAFLERLALGEFASAGEFIPEIVARCDHVIDILNQRVSTEFLMLGLGRPTATIHRPGSPGHGHLLDLLSRVSASLSRAMATIDAPIRIMDQDAAAQLWGLGTPLDDEVNATAHHSIISSWSRVVLTPGVTDGSYTGAARARLYAPRAPGRTDPATALAHAIIDIFPRPTVRAVEAVAIDPTDTLWRAGDVAAALNDWDGFLDIEDYRYTGCREAIAVLRRQGIKIAIVDTQRIAEGDEAAFEKGVRRRCDALVRHPDWDTALAHACRELGVEEVRTLAVRCGAQRSTWWQGAWYGGSAWHLRRVLTMVAPVAVPRKKCKPAAIDDRRARTPMAPDLVAAAVETSLRAVLRLPADATLPRDLTQAGLDSFGALEAIHAIEEACRARFDPGELVPSIAFDMLRLVEAARRAISRSAPAARPCIDPPNPWANLTEPEWTAASVNSLLARKADDGSDWQVRELPSADVRDAAFWSRRALLRRAGGVAHKLRAAGAPPGDRVLIANTGWVARAAAALGLLAGGFVPALQSEADEEYDLNHWARAAAGIAHATKAKWTLCDNVAANALRLAGAPGVLATDSVEPMDLGTAATPEQCGHAPALIQYTSGITSAPKVFVVTRDQILTELWHVGHALQLRPEDRIITFLPQHHAFGLFMTTLLPLLCAIPVIAIRASTWALSPLTFLVEATRSRATLAFMTPSAAVHIAAAAQRTRLPGIDLTTIRELVWAGEPAAPETRDQVLDALKPFGLRHSALAQHYGMTDATAAITHTRAGRAARRQCIAASNLSVGDTVLPRAASAGARREVLSCGPVLPSHTVRILDDAGNAVPEGRLGYIAISGRCLATPLDAAQASRPDTELRTGDLGFMLDGELYPAGRSSDLVIVRGVNVWPQTVENEVLRAIATPGVACVAFGVPDSGRGSEKLVVVAEHIAPPDERELQMRIKKAVGLVTKVVPSAVLFRPVGAIARTLSGKIDRQETRKRFLASEL